MGIFDKLKHSAMDTVMTAATSIGNKNETFTFTSLPESLGELLLPIGRSARTC